MRRDLNLFIIYPDRGKFLRANGTTLILGGMLAFLASVPWRRTSIVAGIFAMLSRALLLVWGWFCIPALLWLLYPKPIVTVRIALHGWDLSQLVVH